MEVTGVGWAGIILGFAAVLLVARREHGVGRLALALALAVVQTASAVYFYYWAQSNTSDAPMYYYDLWDFYHRGFGLSTQFVIWMVQSLKMWFGGSYLDYFLLFQAAGTWGVVFLMKTFEDVFRQAGTSVPSWLLLLLFLPGIHFWTAFIGKDGFLFLGASITGWAAGNVRSRWLAFGIGLLIMMAFRPHIAVLAAASLATAIMLDKQTSILPKVALGSLALVGLVVAAATVRSTFQLDITSAEAVSDYLTMQSEAGQRVEGTTNVANSPFLIKVLSLLFRPLFFDAAGVPALIASLENLILVFVFAYFFYHVRWLVALFKHLLLIRFSVIFSLLLITLLSMVYYNVGLGLRQKMMMMPAVLTIFAALVATSRVQTRRSETRVQPA